VGRVLGYSIMLAVLLAAICAAIAFTLRWPGITRFYHGIDFRSTRAIFLLREGISKLLT
jgi:hypothetical protein